MHNQDLTKFKKIKKETVTEAIIHQIKTLIEEGQFEPGQQLPSERELSNLLEVSRPSVREAMKVLQSMNIVDIRTGSGTFLKNNTFLLADHFNVKNLVAGFTYLELIEARKVLEGVIAYLAAQNATEDNKAAIREAYNDIIQTMGSDDAAFLNADFDFHVAIAESSQNRFLTEMLNNIRELMIMINIDVIKDPDQVKSAVEYHEKIMNSVLTGKTDRARLEMIEHLDTVANRIKMIYS